MFRPTLKPCDIHLTTIAVHPLQQQINSVAIETLLQLIKSSIGPNGKLKLIQNISGGHVSMTSCSSRLLHLVSVKNTFLKIIVVSANSHLSTYGNGGNSCSLFALILLKQTLALPQSNSLMANLNRFLGGLFIDLLESPDNHCVFDISLSNISHLHSVVHSIVSSKPGCFFTEKNEKDVTLLLLKSFISSIPSEGKHVIRNIFFFTKEGLNPSESRLLNGIPLKHPAIESEACITHCVDVFNSGKTLKVAVFSTSLAGDANLPHGAFIESNLPIWKHVVSYLETIADEVIKDEVDILLCQRVVHPSIKKKLQDHHILVVDRLGAETMQSIHLAVGDISVSSLSDAFNITYGYLTSFKSINIGNKKFLLLQNTARPVWTILVCNSNEEALSETKVIFKQAIDTLYRLLKDPRVCCGGGCTEIHTAHLLITMVVDRLSELSAEYDCSSNQLFQALQNFVSCIYDFAVSIHQGSKLSFATETAHGHLWEKEDVDISRRTLKCKCGKNTSHHIDSSQWRHLQQGTLDSIIRNTDFLTSMRNTSPMNEPTVIDELSMKISALKVAIEISSSLLQVGLTITP